MAKLKDNLSEIRLVIPAVPLGLNQLSKHWRRGHFQKKTLQKKWFYLIKEAIQKQYGMVLIPQFDRAKIRLKIYWSKKSRFKDKDNIIGGFKCITDTLVHLELLKNDNPKHLSWAEPEQYQGIPERTEITLTNSPG